MKIVSEASIGTIFKWSCALWSPDPPLQGGINNFARFQSSGSNQYDNVKVNVYCQCLLYLWRKKVCSIKSCSLFTNRGGILVRVWPVQGPFIGALLYSILWTCLYFWSHLVILYFSILLLFSYPFYYFMFIISKLFNKFALCLICMYYYD